MTKREKLNKLGRNFYDVIEDEVKRYKDSSKDSKISYINLYGDTPFCHHKYKLCGDGECGNPVIENILKNKIHDSPYFSFYNKGYLFEFCLVHPDAEIQRESSFTKYDRNKNLLYSLKGEEILNNPEFKELFLQMIEDIAPEKISEFEKLLA